MKAIKRRALWMALCLSLISFLCACQGGADSPEPPPDAAQNADTGQDADAGQNADDGQEAETGEADASSPAQPDGEAQADAAPSSTMQFQLGSSSYAMQVPRSYRNGDVSIDELQGGQIAYYYSAESDLDFDIYQFAKPDLGISLEEFLRAAAADFNGHDLTFRQINGINVGTYKSREIYDGVEYDVLTATLEEGDEYVQVLFWLDGENAEAEAAQILDTLSPIETYDLQLGESPYWITVPADYHAGEVTEEEAADDMIAYYKSESSPLDFDVYEFGKNGYTLEKYAIEEAKRYEAERVDYRTINDIDVAVYFSYEEYDGQTYRLSNYLFEYGDDFVELAFWLDGEVAVKQADRIISSLTKSND